MKKSLWVSGMVLVVAGLAAAQEAQPREVIPAKTDGKVVPPEVLQQIYEEVKTPYKYGIVIDAEKGSVDCPAVFRHGDKWYMMYIAYVGRGYETHIAESADLLAWKELGKIMSFAEDAKAWDANQTAGYIALQDHQWGGSCTLQQYAGKYWLSYFGGSTTGFEKGKLGIGIASTDDPAAVKPWNRLESNPVLTPDQPDARGWEKTKLFKSNVIWDKSGSLGYPFVMYYNAALGKQECIGMAVSKDMKQWLRYGKDPVVAGGTISGDPQIVKIGDVWVMFYFMFVMGGNKTFDTFACSYDLATWTKWNGKHLIEPSEPWDIAAAHKPWIIKHDGVVYHYYCACKKGKRAIGLATSKDLKGTEKK